MNFYDRGEVVEITGEFRDGNGALANPTTTVIEVRLPDGSTTNLVPDNPSVGLFTADYPIADDAEHGVYCYRIIGTGVIAAVEEGEFAVRVSCFA